MFQSLAQSLADPLVLAGLAIGYLLGSIPFGLLLTRMTGHGDIRAIGSGNIGATNVLRTGSKGLALATLLGDALKGTAAVLVGGALAGLPGALAAGFGSFLGHLYPVWLKFRGGKGTATYIGVALGLYWQAVLVFAVAWLGAAALTRYSSVGALTASVATTVAFFLFGQWQMGVLFIPITLLLWLRHATNIQRLAAGTESKIGQKA
jgi:acyl phosphate:glycerol-3-phosphate acyltransferase